MVTDSALALAGLKSAALLTAPVAAYAVDPQGRICFWNHAATAMFGWEAAEVMGRLPPFISSDEAERALEALVRVMRGEEVVHEEYTPRRRNRESFRVVCSGTLVRDDQGHPIAALTLVRDVTEEAAADERRRNAEHKWRQLATRTADTITIADADGHVVESTGELKPTLGYPAGWWKGKSGFELLHPDDVERAATAWATLVSSPGSRVREVYRARHQLGHYEQMEFTGVNMLDDPIIHGIVVASRVVSARQQAESLIADEAKVFELIAKDASLSDVLDKIVEMVEFHTGASCGILLVDEQLGSVELGSQGSMPDALVDLVKRTRLATFADDREQPPTEATSPSDSGFAVRVPVIIRDFSTDPRTASFAGPLADLGVRGGWSIPIIESRSDALYGVVATYVREPREPTEHERKVTEAASYLAAIAVERSGWQLELWQQARFDPLTGLPNRSLIFEQLDDTLNRARVRRTPVTVMLIDLDRFKLINDSLGHNVGDVLICSLADRLRAVVGAEHFVGRVGADEFVIIFPAGVRAREAKLTASRVTKALHQPFTVDEDNIYLTASIGIATADTGRENADTLLQQADAAMYSAKDLGRDRTEVFDEGLRTQAVARLELDRDLRLALERQELVLHYQPEIDCRTGRIVGAEALLRWVHPQHGLIPPDGFITIAEETGVIVPIGHWVLDEAVRQARLWTDADPSIEPFAMSVNLSARQLINRSLVDTVAFVLTRYNWPPSLLTLELTESILIEDRDATLFVLNRLRMLGVKLSIDDFGTGFASLDYLQKLHVDSIKIDRSFVTTIDAKGNGSPVATAMMHMAKAFDLTVTAEGVEAPEQFQGLKAIQCDLAQGFLFARPLPADKMDELLRSRRRW
jgi:diguanylate cyclase (GGDEF)-like protein/PAS domain S-box-containing protein